MAETRRDGSDIKSVEVLMILKVGKSELDVFLATGKVIQVL